MLVIQFTGMYTIVSVHEFVTMHEISQLYYISVAAVYKILLLGIIAH